jgi:hypothetical protein
MKFKFFKSIIRCIQQNNKKSVKGNDTSPYNSLSPTNEAENIENYIETLNWALQNRKKIKNIAITGPYGSGKSSIIQTFQHKNLNTDYHFLNISLATFKEERDTANKPDKNIRLIELSILQQLFYREKDSKIPDSRFKKIKSHKKWFLSLLAICFTVLLMSLINLIFSELINKFFTISTTTNKLINHTSLAFTLIGVCFIVYKLIRILKGLAIKKLTLNNAEIEIDEKVNKSILNNHIDEILYFFEVTKYNIVTIEDLDRFKQTEVFAKLREINLLLNNSKKIARDIVFIYAIRDDMLQDNDRTKFFDFMIPIIPVINSSNSNEKLLKIVRENKYKISQDLLDDISLFIDDLRLLYNIMNEYHLYSNILNNSLDQNKLLSIIVYKNIHPNDFTELSNNKGILYKTISAKRKYITERIDEIDNEIVQIKANIQRIDLTLIKDINELRIIYLTKIIEKINISGQAFRCFWINNQEHKINQAIEKTIFQYLIDNKIVAYSNFNSNGHRADFKYDFEDIEKEINNDITYKEREQLTNDFINNRVELLKEDIDALEEKKNIIKKYKIKELLVNKDVNIEVDNDKQGELINILLRNGYIDEHYLDYISIFYEGSLAKSDYQFLINIKTQQSTEFNYQLHKVEKLIKKIHLFEFEKKYILNYSLLDFLLSNNKQKLKRNRIFEQLKNETDLSVKFIDGFIDYTTNIEKFMLSLCEHWIHIWDFIERKSNFTEKKKDKYFKLIIEYANVKDIKNSEKYCLSRIINDKSFLTITKNTDKLKEIIKVMNIKFTDLDESSPDILLDFIYDGNYYCINPQMLKLILKHKKAYNQVDFETKNYSAIKLSKLPNLIEYIDNDIDDYIVFAYQEIKSNTNEPLEFLIKLLNNDDLSIKHKITIVKQTKTIVDDINVIEDIEVVNLLLEYSKILETWGNIFSVYLLNEKEFSDELNSFIDVPKNSSNLSGRRINKEYPDKVTADEFIVSLLKNENISNENYSLIMNSIPYIYNSLDFSTLSFEKAEILIDKNKLTTNVSNFNMLKESFDNLHIKLIEHNSQNFIENIDSFEIDDDDLLKLLRSSILLINQKETIIEFNGFEIFTENSTLLNQIIELLLDNLNLNIDKNILKSILLTQELKTSEKIQIIIINHHKLEKEDLMEILSSLEESYSRITVYGKRPLISNNDLNLEFVDILKEKSCISKYSIEKKGIRISTFRFNRG